MLFVSQDEALCEGSVRVIALDWNEILIVNHLICREERGNKIWDQQLDPCQEVSSSTKIIQREGGEAKAYNR